MLGLAVLGAGVAFLLLSRADDPGSSNSGGSPAHVAQTFIEAARTQDCETMVSLVSHNSLAGPGASREQQIATCQQIDIVPYEFTVTGAEVVRQDADTATVKVTADVPGGTDSDTVELVNEDGAWTVSPPLSIMRPRTAAATSRAMTSTWPPPIILVGHGSSASGGRCVRRERLPRQPGCRVFS